MCRIKIWRSFFLLEFTSIQVQSLGVSEPAGFLRLQLEVQLTCWSEKGEYQSLILLVCLWILLFLNTWIS